MSWLQAHLLPVLLTAAVAYLAGNALTGRQGAMATMRLAARERALERDIAALEAQKIVVADRAARLGAAQLDLDYLEERARAVLGAARPGEVFLRDGFVNAL